MFDQMADRVNKMVNVTRSLPMPTAPVIWVIKGGEKESKGVAVVEINPLARAALLFYVSVCTP